MVTEEEQDAALAAILDSNIGIGPDGWDPKLERRCAARVWAAVSCCHACVVPPRARAPGTPALGIPPGS